MYFCIKHFQKYLVIKKNWIKGVDSENVRNFGFQNKNYTFFFSLRETDEPDFNLEIKTVFNEEEPACYVGKILVCFSKCLYFLQFKL